MKNGWDDILRFIFNSVVILAILGVLFLIKLLFGFFEVGSMKNSDTLLVGFDHSNGDIAVLIVGRKEAGNAVQIVNQFRGKEAEELYQRLLQKRGD